MTTFTKGDRVWLINLWSHQDCSFTVREAVVYSCGAKQMILTDPATGKEIGRNFLPTTKQNHGMVVSAVAHDETEALNIGTHLSADAIRSELGRLRSRIDNPSFYQPGILQDIARLEACTATAKRFAARRA